MKNPTLKEALLQRIEEFPLYVEMKLKYDKSDKKLRKQTLSKIRIILPVILFQIYTLIRDIKIEFTLHKPVNINSFICSTHQQCAILVID